MRLIACTSYVSDVDGRSNCRRRGFLPDRQLPSRVATQRASKISAYGSSHVQSY